MRQMVEVGDRLSHRKHHLVRVQLAREQDMEQFASAAGSIACRQQLLAAVAMVLLQLGDPRMQTMKRQTVRW